jgi:hypothetical protein
MDERLIKKLTGCSSFLLLVSVNSDLSIKLVPREGLEPTLPCGKRILSPPRLPFRHLGDKDRGGERI